VIISVIAHYKDDNLFINGLIGTNGFPSDASSSLTPSSRNVDCKRFMPTLDLHAGESRHNAVLYNKVSCRQILTYRWVSDIMA
jgi:hypothetical protein